MSMLFFIVWNCVGLCGIVWKILNLPESLKTCFLQLMCGFRPFKETLSKSIKVISVVRPYSFTIFPFASILMLLLSPEVGFLKVTT